MEHINYLNEKIVFLKKVLSKVPLPVFVTDLNSMHFTSQKGRMLIDNYGLTKKKDILKVEYLITGRDGEVVKLKDVVKNCKSTGGIRVERELHNSGLHYYDLKVNAIEYKDHDLYILTMNDITEIKESEEERALKKFKAVMFASMTHEIRTPLNAIINS
mmetsp:Transcript_3638/g.4458  ORF Transcript_3638/g.4458 Transcript_3638/m.4458 type:complete len:159 (+) Transcript_3638:790-1266(+)